MNEALNEICGWDGSEMKEGTHKFTHDVHSNHGLPIRPQLYVTMQ